MIKTTLFSVAAALTFASVSQASIVTLSGTRTGPLVVNFGGGAPVSGGLVRLGTLSGAPASNAVADIDAVFNEFATGFTAADGKLGQTFNNAAAASFNGQQVYIWVFDTATQGAATQQAMLTVADPNAPDAGNAWVYPTHTGSGTDSATLTLGALLTGADTSVTPGVVFGANNIQLAPIPEPSGALLAGLAGVLIAFRRRR